MNKTIKKVLKPILLPLYRWLTKDRVWWRMFLSVVSPVYASKRLYKRALGKKLNLKNPQTLNEKCMWLKLNTYYNNPLITECCDKYLVRNYVKRMGYSEILNDLIGVWNNPDEIDFNSLPDKFVLKCNHGCGYNIICTDKNTLNIQKTKKQLKKWLREDFWKLYAETQYKFIKKRIICEKYIETKDSPLPIDYKFFCENGKFKTLQIITDRETDITLYYFDEALNYRPDYYSLDEVDVVNIGHPKLPSNIKDMIKIAEHLSSPFPFVKVDLYNADGKILFSELTFIPYGGIHYTQHANLPSDIKFTSIPKNYLLTK
ncbi:glycosyl transferase [Treponema denticola]|uniref:Glycosyl transferase n=1 Tax=Treponema denticola H-22 TaxID=999432 RepID=A0A0E2EKB6_TREDN|nr:ATP-grasp fold amidoligase family protein [Treponema denticola]EMB36018.1 hypothetical protein HMPREF9726_00210 [Treponema denticola H-22]